MTLSLRSPLPWIGGKYYSAQRILAAFPAPESYNTYVELFGGAAHVLMQKPPDGHVEVYNDVNGDLVNFWMACRDQGEELEVHCRSLPYSRALYYQYHASLFDGTALDPFERAVRWYYVLRSSFTARVCPSPQGWSASVLYRGDAFSYRTALDLFPAVQVRFRDVLIDHRDFAQVFQQHNQPRTLFYVDPPYVGAEGYYDAAFTQTDHERLAVLLNQTQARVALSYYPHALLDTLYPPARWRRIIWEVTKHSQRSRATKERATEMLLCNYPVPTATLWEVSTPEREASA